MKDKYPLTCTACKSPAYISCLSIDCSNWECKHGEKANRPIYNISIAADGDELEKALQALATMQALVKSGFYLPYTASGSQVP